MKIFRKGFALSALIFATTAINAQEIRFVMSGTSFTVADLRGTDITVTGVDAGQSVSVGDSIDQVYTAPNGATVVFRGNITKMNITAGNIASADLSAAPSTLRVFSLNNTGTSSVNLSGATNLTGLSLRCGISHVDLSNQRSLKTLFLGKRGDEEGKTWNLKTVVFPTPNVIETLDLSNTSFSDVANLDNLPKLKNFTAVGTHLSGTLSLQASSELQTVILGRNSKMKGVSLSNRPALKNIFIGETAPIFVNLSNNPALATGRVSIPSLACTSLDLSNCGLTSTSAINFANMPALSKLDLSGNNLSGAEWSSIIQNLNSARRDEGAMLTTSAADEAIFSQDIKTLLDSKGWGLNGTPTDIHSSQVGGAKATVSGSTLQVTGIKANASVKVYAISGVQVANGQADADGNVSVELAGCTAGTYVVVADGFSQRIVVR